MLRGRTALSRAALILALALLWASSAAATDPTIGAPCTSISGYSTRNDNGNNTWCNGSTYQYPAYWFGSTSTGCSSATAGLVQWTGSAFEGCNGSIWGSLGGGGGSSALSALTSSTTANTIDNAAYAQTWSWNSLSSGTAFTISSNSMTTGTLLSLQDTAAAATSTGKVLSISDTTTGPGYGVYSVMSGLGNTGYAGYFANTDTGAANYGLYASTSSSLGYAGYFQGPVNIASSAQIGSTTASCGGGNGGALQYTTSGVLELCNGSNWTSLAGSSAYDLAMFYPGTLQASGFVRVVADHTATYPTNLAGSSCVAKEGATSSTTITLNQIHAGTSTNVGTVVFGSGGGTNVTNCTFTAASGISLAIGDALEFVFPASPDATLGDIAITIAGTHT
jgi:hypothetical protein